MSKNKRLIAKIKNGNEVLTTIDSNMISCEFGSLDRGNIADIVNWGIYANTGHISFVDNNGNFNNYIINSPDIKSYSVEFYLAKNNQKLISTFKIDSADFDDETKIVDINVISGLLRLQNIQTNSVIYPFVTTSSKTLLYLINDAIGDESAKIAESVGFPTTIKIGCPYIAVDSVWNVATKLCQATMCRVIENPNGEASIAGEKQIKTPIVVNPHNIISVQKAGFAINENPCISYTIRKKYSNAFLDKANQKFSLSWDTSSIENASGDRTEKFLGSQGITISNLVKTETFDSYGRKSTEITANGVINIETPYKIYSISGNNNQQSIYNVRNVGHRTEEDYPFVDSESSRSNPELFSNETIENEQNISANFDGFTIYSDNFLYVDGDLYGNMQHFVSNGTTSFAITTFEDIGTTRLSYDKDYAEEDVIQSNDLIQDISTYGNGDDEIDLSTHIVTETYKRYHKGVECFEIDCLFNDYVDENGDIVYDGNNFTESHFEKYDVIIPYLMRNGQKVPLRENQDGTAKKFRIIGISYSYDGLLKQRLSVQEERYDID